MIQYEISCKGALIPQDPITLSLSPSVCKMKLILSVRIKSINDWITTTYSRLEKVKIKVRLGPKGQLVIPKVVRESVGLHENASAVLEVKEKAIEIRPLEASGLVERASRRAVEHGGDIKKLGWIYGDRLYEEVFRS